MAGGSTGGVVDGPSFVVHVVRKGSTLLVVLSVLECFKVQQNTQ